ncbi:MAG: polysaccharide deacetylase family protein [Deltaproteobacteria bacterium]|nr:polysaccharide deacetylase family protein [Deltaproteobacteria bacterium]
MRKKASLIIFAILIACACVAAPFEARAASTPVFKPFHGRDGSLLIAIRSIDEGKETKYLAIDARSFKVSVIGKKEMGKAALESEWKATPYARALKKYNKPYPGSQNAGLTRGARDGLYLTVDLCPSTKKMDAQLFKAISELDYLKEKPLPVAIAVSGMWIQRHEDELASILELERKGAISITWVNHTMTHPYDVDKPIEENFLLMPEVDFEKEILDNEETMLKRGLIPSPFFRFPGLVSDTALLARLERLSLIPIGADAWLAKGEVPQKGSIILVHGNGNEPFGVKKLIEFLETKKKELETGELRFLPLRDAPKR